MPELPEVEFCGRALGRWTAGREIERVEIVDPRVVRSSRTDRPAAASAEAASLLVRIARRPGALVRHGKRLLWEFEHGFLLLHLGMTGRWTRSSSGYPKVVLHLDNGDALTFHDPRLLGGIVPFEHRHSAETALHDGLGPDALAGPLPHLLGRRAIKVALMDQSDIAGVGNVQAMEALWRAGIHPLRQAGSLTAAEHARLDAALHEQLLSTLDLLGEGDEITYVEERGAPNPFPLYQRDGEACPRCMQVGRDGVIETFRQAGRGTWFCPRCQGGDTSAA